MIRPQDKLKFSKKENGIIDTIVKYENIFKIPAILLVTESGALNQ